MYRIWAVARHMIAESIRQKIALVGIVLVLLMLTVLPFVVEGDGVTLASRMQSFLAYTLGGVGVVLSVVTVFLSCLAITDEVSNKRIFMIATKPIPRWQFLVGKWLGISVLNAALLLVSFFAILGGTWAVRQMKTTVPGDRESLKFEVLSARHSIPLEQPDFGPEVENRIRKMREEGRLQDVNAQGENNIREQILTDVSKAWRSLSPHEVRRFEFKGLMVDRKAGGFVHLRFKPTHAGGLSDASLPAIMQCGDPAEPETLTDEVSEEYLVERFHTIPIPTWAVNKDGTLYVVMANAHDSWSFNFEGADSLELLYDLGTFHWNLFRAFSIIWCRLAFVAAFGLLMSTFLSFPVACMGCFLVLFVSSTAGFLANAMDWVTPLNNPTARDSLMFFGPIIRPVAQVFIWAVPDFSRFDAVDNVVNGRLVPLMWVINSVVVLVLIKGLIIGLLGCIVLTKRELAQVTS
jgi:hypothetical protein